MTNIEKADKVVAKIKKQKFAKWMTRQSLSKTELATSLDISPSTIYSAVSRNNATRPLLSAIWGRVASGQLECKV